MKEVVCVAALLALAAVFFHEPLFLGKAYVPGDLLEYLSPWREALARKPSFHNSAISDGIISTYPFKYYLAEELHNGNVPLWNPHILCGEPFAANNTSAVFYPFNALFFSLLPAWRAIGLSDALHMFLAGLFMFLLLRTLGLGRAASTIGGAGYMLSGWFVMFVHTINFLDSGIWLPLVLCLYEAAVRRGRAGPALLAGAALGAQLTAGFLQASAYALILLGAYAVWRAGTEWARERSARAAVKPVMYAAAVVAAGFAIAAVQLLPTLEILPFCQRIPSTIEKALHTGIFPAHLINFFAPDFFGNPAHHDNFFIAGQYPEFNAYVGVCMVFLAAAGLALGARKGRGWVWFFATAGVAALMLALATPLYVLFHMLVPGADVVRANRFLYLMPVCICVAGAAGADAYIGRAARGADDKWPWARVAIACAIVLAAAGWCLNISADYIMQATGIPAEKLWAIERPRLIFFGAFAGATVVALLIRNILPRGARGVLLFGLVAADLMLWGKGFGTSVVREAVAPVTPSIKFLMDAQASGEPGRVHSFRYNTMPPDTAMSYGLEDIRGFDSIFPGRYARLLVALDESRGHTPFKGDTNIAFTSVITGPLFDYMNVRYEICPDYIHHADYRPAFDKDVRVYENTAALPRAYAVTRWRVASAEDEARRVVISPGFEPRREVVLEEAPGVAQYKDEIFVPAAVKYPSSGRAEIRFKCPGPCVLSLADEWDGGWRVTLDGRPARLLRANVAFRAVPVATGGEHVITMVYSPRSVRVGIAISMIAMFVILGGGVKGLTQRARRWHKGHEEELMM